ncbi:MAG: hypothetical protein HFH32_06285 [Eubacterium sp.]|jgi:hypothetical protein|nr:hypothetical protein [Eubacterium sp.]
MNRRREQKEPNGRYFQEALSDFMYDAASGKAIRHLADSGFTTAQITRQLCYPTPFRKVQHTVTDYFKETGILLEALPVEQSCFKKIHLNNISAEHLFSRLVHCIHNDSEENSYVLYPFASDCGALSVLTAREREYLEGIAWEPAAMYHRLNRRMLEISVQLAMLPGELCFYFLKNKILYHVKNTNH